MAFGNGFCPASGGLAGRKHASIYLLTAFGGFITLART
jgi:hypothetical protein